MRLLEIARRSEMLPPISIADKNGGSCPFFSVAGVEIPPEDRLNGEDLKKVGRDACNNCACRLRKLLKQMLRRSGTWQSPGSCGFGHGNRRNSGPQDETKFHSN